MSKIEDLQATVANYRALLKETRRNLARAEAELAKAQKRASNPQVGDFARSTLTHFYGCITRVVPRSSGKPWVEITPYLTADLPGKSTMDLYDQWELIEKPVSVSSSAEASSPLEIVTSLTASLQGQANLHSNKVETIVEVERVEQVTVIDSALARSQGNVLTAIFGRKSDRKNSA